MWNFNATVMWMIRKEEAALMWKILVSAPEEELPPGFPRPVSPILYLPLCRISLPSCISNAAVSLNFSAIYSALLYFLLCCILLRCISYTAVLPSLLHCPILVPGLIALFLFLALKTWPDTEESILPCCVLYCAAGHLLPYGASLRGDFRYTVKKHCNAQPTGRSWSWKRILLTTHWDHLGQISTQN